MGQQSILYGMIAGPGDGPKLTPLKLHNQCVIESLPTDDEWPWLTRAMFAFPAPWPQGTYQEQVIHFGLSIKDFLWTQSNQTTEPTLPHRGLYEGVTKWILKLESLLRQMYWYSAQVHIYTEIELNHVYRYVPSTDCLDLMMSDAPKPIDVWEMSHSWDVE